jgi:hypothetical protein
VDHLLAEAVRDDPRSRLAASVVLGVVPRSASRNACRSMPSASGRLIVTTASCGFPLPAAARCSTTIGWAGPWSGSSTPTGPSSGPAWWCRHPPLPHRLLKFHKDSTSITFTGNYTEATGQPRRGHPSARIARGHNKDHRDDLKQLLWTLTVAADGTTLPIYP